MVSLPVFRLCSVHFRKQLSPAIDTLGITVFSWGRDCFPPLSLGLRRLPIGARPRHQSYCDETVKTDVLNETLTIIFVRGAVSLRQLMTMTARRIGAKLQRTSLRMQSRVAAVPK